MGTLRPWIVRNTRTCDITHNGLNHETGKTTILIRFLLWYMQTRKTQRSHRWHYRTKKHSILTQFLQVFSRLLCKSYRTKITHESTLKSKPRFWYGFYCDKFQKYRFRTKLFHEMSGSIRRKYNFWIEKQVTTTNGSVSGATQTAAEWRPFMKETNVLPRQNTRVEAKGTQQ